MTPSEAESAAGPRVPEPKSYHGAPRMRLRTVRVGLT